MRQELQVLVHEERAAPYLIEVNASRSSRPSHWCTRFMAGPPTVVQVRLSFPLCLTRSPRSVRISCCSPILSTFLGALEQQHTYCWKGRKASHLNPLHPMNIPRTRPTIRFRCPTFISAPQLYQSMHAAGGDIGRILLHFCRSTFLRNCRICPGIPILDRVREHSYCWRRSYSLTLTFVAHTYVLRRL